MVGAERMPEEEIVGPVTKLTAESVGPLNVSVTETFVPEIVVETLNVLA